MAAIPGSLQEALADRYQLERVIGQGGMATVYLARDRKHNRDVAVKVLRPDLAATIGAERFLREIQIAARLQHPNILLLIDSGNAGGHLHYVMPFVAGESLRGRLDRRGALAPSQALDIARQVASALEYAHRHGVVHRDVKPENILLTEDHAFVADFGIAKAVSEATDRSLTRTGHPVGTIGYMSPEQAAGFDELDARSDVYSLGCVLYEMVIGRVPGFWVSEEASRLRRFVDAPAAQRERLDRLPGSLEQVMVAALGLRPEQRFSSPVALVEAFAAALGERPKYREPEVRAIVQRAAEIEATAPTDTGALTLGGIQRIAADVGIAPEHVERAARQVSTRSTNPEVPVNKFLGTPTRIVIERLVDGEVDDREFAAIVDEVRTVVGNVGQASTLGRSLSWTSGVGPGQIQRAVSLSVTPVSGRTRIRLEENIGQVAGGLFGGLMGGIGGPSIAASIGLAVAALQTPLLIPVFIGTAVAGAWGLARVLLRRTAAKRRAELERLADRLEAHIIETVSGRSGRQLPR
ncbi:MAG: serine/threonine protein kinase [Gemmatimonadetes bacterium]|nr:serine/threonine protein kinase [Gemmatimonadota bacterium]